MKTCSSSKLEKAMFFFNLSSLLESAALLMQFRGPLSLKLVFWLRSEWSYIQFSSSLLGILGYALKFACSSVGRAFPRRATLRNL